jgi:predicted nucleotidyltransferase
VAAPARRSGAAGRGATRDAGVGVMNGPTAKQIEVLKIVAEWANRFPCIRNIYVFGSFARGVEIPHDIDIAVDYSEDVTKRTALKCYTDVNAASTDLEQSLSRTVQVRVGWTGLSVLRDGYDKKAWAAIRSGEVRHCCGKVGVFAEFEHEKPTMRAFRLCPSIRGWTCRYSMDCGKFLSNISMQLGSPSP